MKILNLLRRVFSRTYIPLVFKPYKKRIMGRREAVLAVLLEHKYLDCYQIAQRCGIDPLTCSKTLSTAVRDGSPIERVRKAVSIPRGMGRVNANNTVWCYRIAFKNGIRSTDIVINEAKCEDTKPQPALFEFSEGPFTLEEIKAAFARN